MRQNEVVEIVRQFLWKVWSLDGFEKNKYYFGLSGYLSIIK